MTPDQFDSFTMGVNLNSSSYSGGMGGTFTDLVQGAGFWSLDSGTPLFDTRAGLEGKLFTGLSTDRITAPMIALHECTILCIAQAATGTQTALYGGTLSSGNSWSGTLNGNRLFTNSPPAVGASTIADAAVSSAPTVFVSSWSPRAATLYSQVNDGAVASVTGDGKFTRINWAEMAIGSTRLSYFSGWIARVLVFSKALHERDPSGLQSLIATEMATIGL